MEYYTDYQLTCICLRMQMHASTQLHIHKPV